MARGLVRALRALGIEVLTTFEAGRLRSSDEEQLAFAALEGRAIYTANQADYARLHDRWMNPGSPSCRDHHPDSPEHVYRRSGEGARQAVCRLHPGANG